LLCAWLKRTLWNTLVGHAKSGDLFMGHLLNLFSFRCQFFFRSVVWALSNERGEVAWIEGCQRWRHYVTICREQQRIDSSRVVMRKQGRMSLCYWWWWWWWWWWIESLGRSEGCSVIRSNLECWRIRHSLCPSLILPERNCRCAYNILIDVCYVWCDVVWRISLHKTRSNTQRGSFTARACCKWRDALGGTYLWSSYLL
jgi:hypothetical protein